MLTYLTDKNEKVQECFKRRAESKSFIISHKAAWSRPSTTSFITNNTDNNNNNNKYFKIYVQFNFIREQHQLCSIFQFYKNTIALHQFLIFGKIYFLEQIKFLNTERNRVTNHSKSLTI